MNKALSLSLILLLSSSTLQALEQDHQVGLKVGLTSIDNEDGWNFENGSFFTDLRFDLPYQVKPRVDLGYISIDEDEHGGVSSLLQLAINGIYDIDLNRYYTTPLEPYILGGLGYEYVSNSTPVFESHSFAQVGFGARYPLTDKVKLVSEFKAVQMLGGDNEENEFTFTVGIDIPLFVEVIQGTIDPNIQTTQEIITPEVHVQREYQAPQQVTTQTLPATVTNDGDGDGVSDDIDNCPHTPSGDKVNEKGCTIVSSIILPEEASYIEDGASSNTIIETSQPEVVKKQVLSVPSPKKIALSSSIGNNSRKNLKIVFEPNSARITTKSRIIVKRFADSIKDPNVKITVEGYTDNSGDRNKNLALSKKRAQAVKSLLVKYGLKASNIEAVGKGDLNPIADNDTEYGRKLNRRIEIIIH